MSRRKFVAKKLSEIKPHLGRGFCKKIAERIEDVTYGQVKDVFCDRCANEKIINKVFAKAIELAEENLLEEETAKKEVESEISKTELVKQKILPSLDNFYDSKSAIEVTRKKMY